ncbi:MAG: hypothetical protein OXG49_08025 [Chloroflexi bacterium]|nr:hypothetical protein [Chloroflexota bacterium]
MLDLIPPMGSVLLTWLLLFLLFSGLGFAVLRALGKPLASGWVWMDSFWLGWALSLGIMQFWHFAFPVNDALALLFAVVAALTLVGRRQSVVDLACRLSRNRMILIPFAILALWMSNRALGMPIAYDTGFRDLQAVSWIDSFPIIPGLGNLFSSLAFNHSVYLYDALLDTSIWSGRSVYIATGLLLTVYLAYALGAAAQVLRSRVEEEARWSSVFASATIPFILFQTVRWGGITHFLTDTVVDLIGFITLIYLLDFLQYWRPNNGSRDYLVYRLAIIILTGFTVKQSFIVYGFAAAMLAFAVWLRRGGTRSGARRIQRTVALVFVVGLMLLLPWMARGFVTSGYIAYPQSIGRFNADWTIPADQVEARQRTLATNTRLRGGDPDAVLSSWDWLGPWLRDLARNIFPISMPTIVSVIALALYFYGTGKNRPARQAAPLSWWALLPLMVMLAFWFVTAPEDKYVRYVFWSFAALSITMAMLAWRWIAWRRRLLAVFAFILISLAYVVFLIIRHEEILAPAGPKDGFHAPFLPEYNRYETEHGLTVHVPIGMSQCWSIPLPCTPYPESALSARVPGDLRHGFRMAANHEAG